MPPTCQIVPLEDNQVSFLVNGEERLKWNPGSTAPRPFFFPVVSPSGRLLTRMGHPGAANHDHHRSIWFAHAKILGIDFWSDQTAARIVQRQWLAYRDGDDFAAMSVVLDWVDGHDPQPLIEQQMVAALHPLGDGELLLELQSSFTPHSATLELGQSNFGFLAIRVAKSIAAYFGGGEIRDSRGRVGEPDIFGQAAEWIDYSGPTHADGAGQPQWEGITCIVHAGNERAPNKWHVREDGWMGPSHCRDASFELTRDDPLQLRYLLHIHRGQLNPDRTHAIAEDFATWKPLAVERSDKRHIEYEIRRIK